MNRKLFIGILALVIFIGAVIVFIVIATQKKDEPSIVSVSDSNKTTVTISNSSDYADKINEDTFATLRQNLYRNVSMGIENPKNTYVSQIRAGSFKSSTQQTPESDQKTFEYQFLVDIPTAKRTYTVDISGQVGNASPIVNVACPETSQLKYGKFNCESQL